MGGSRKTRLGSSSLQVRARSRRRVFAQARIRLLCFFGSFLLISPLLLPAFHISARLFITHSLKGCLLSNPTGSFPLVPGFSTTVEF